MIALCCIAVPMFLLISGYYYPELKAKGKEKLYLKKIVRLSLFSTVFL